MTTRVPIRYGGTGANTATDARTALGVSSSETTNAAYAQANSAFDQANLAYDAANTKFASAGGTISGDVTVTGNLFVEGDSTTFNVASLLVEDNEVILNSNQPTPSLNASIVAERGTANDTFVRWVEGANTWGWSDDGSNFYTFDTALSAYAQANTAYDAANTANTTSLSAYGQANAAYDQANSAYGQANDAYTTANTANTNSLATYDQANSAYTAANSAANTVRVSQNSNSTLSAKQLNFVNTANVTIAITDSGDGNANVEIFSAAGGGAGIADFPVSANSGSTVTANALNFINTSSVTVSVASGIDGNANISFTSTGGSGSATETVAKSDLFTAANGDANLTYSLTYAVPGTDYVFVNKNGIALVPGTDFVVDTFQTLRVIDTGETGDVIEAHYFTPASTILIPNTDIIIDTNTVTAQTNTFYLSANITSINLLTVTKNGLTLTPNSHFTLSDNNTITLTTVAEVDDELVFRFFRDVTLERANSNNSVSSTFTANGSANVFFMDSHATSNNNVLVTIDGVVLIPVDDYTVDGPILTINYMPPNGAKIEARTITGGGDGSGATLGFVRNSFVGDGNTVNYTLTVAPNDEDNCLVYVDRVLQRNNEYNVSTTTLTFDSAPDANAVIDVFTTTYKATSFALMKAGDTMTGNLNVSATLITQNVEPVANVTYDLGTSTKRFKDLWLSNSTIYLGEASISANGGNIVVPSIQTSSGVNVEAVLADAYNQANSAFDAANNRVLKAGDTMTGLLNVANSLIVTGNVGVGTENPRSKMHILGGFNALSNSSIPSLSLSGDYGGGLAFLDTKESGFYSQDNGDSFFAYVGRTVDIDTTGSKIVQTWKSNGSVGIGTTNPEYKLHVAGTVVIKSSEEGGPYLYRDNDSSPDIRFHSTAGTFASPSPKASGGLLGQIHWHGWDGDAYRVGAQLWALVDGAVSSGTLPARLEFKTGTNGNPTPRMVIKSDGKVGIGTTSPAQQLDISGSNRVSGYYLFNGNSSDPGDSAASFYDRALTGPTISGLNITFRAGSTPAEYLRISSTGNIGIGNDSPGFKLDISEAGAVIEGTATTGSNMKGLRLYNTTTSTTNNAIGLWLATGPHQAGIASFRAAAATGWDTCLAFYTHGNATTNLNDATERMRIHGEGYVTQPYQPAFTALSNAGTTDYSAGQVIVFNQIHFNTGSHYNTSNGRFTAPVAGKYMFTYTLYGFSSGIVATVLTVNGNQLGSPSSDVWPYIYGSQDGTTDRSRSTSVILNLAAGDYVEMRSRATNTSKIYMGHSYFSGYLIG